MSFDPPLRTWAAVLCLLLVPACGTAPPEPSEPERMPERLLASTAASADDAFAAGYLLPAENGGPLQQAIGPHPNAHYQPLGPPSEAHVTLGLDGHVFLNGGNDDAINALFDIACVQAHTDENAASIRSALDAWAATATARGLRLDLVLVPTAASLYADKLPDHVPPSLRRACGKRTAGHSPLRAITAPPGLHFLYPLREMLAHRADPAFFPRANWHPTGLSMQVVRDTYLRSLEVQGDVDEELILAEAPSEILLRYGIEQPEPTYFIHNLHLAPDPDLDTQVRDAIASSFKSSRFITHAFSNTAPVIDETVVMFTDSFGDYASETFAGAFRRVIQINGNHLSGSALEIIDQIRELTPVDRIILLMQEAGTRRLRRWNR